MEILFNHEQARVTFFAKSEKDAAILAAITSKIAISQPLVYRGKELSPDGSEIVAVWFARHEKVDPSEPGFVDKGNSETWRIASTGPELYELRDVCFLGVKLNLAENGMLEDTPWVSFVSSRTCSNCGQSIIGHRECYSKICDRCVEVCEHDFQNVPVITQRGLGIAQACKKCLIDKPNSLRPDISHDQVIEQIEKTGLVIASIPEELGDAVCEKLRQASAGERHGLTATEADAVDELLTS